MHLYCKSCINKFSLYAPTEFPIGNYLYNITALYSIKQECKDSKDY